MGLVNNAEKCNMFGFTWGPAAVTWEGMEFYGESKVDWASMKKYFLKMYQGEVDVETFYLKIAKLYQEPTNNFGVRRLKSVYEQFKSLPPPAAAALNGKGAAVVVATKANIHQSTLKVVTDVKARSFFLSGLKENLRNMMMQKTTLTLREAIDKVAK